jgi:hypothetical protein
MLILDALETTVPPSVWQTTVITLFILSLINERIVNFIKLNLQRVWENHPKWKLIKWLNQNVGNLRDKETSKAKEKLRERGIMNTSIFVGFWVALSAQLDLFKIVEEAIKIPNSNNDSLLWGFWGHFKQGISYLFSGIFLSFGSKFWHDMLDLIFYASNLKSKITDPNTFTVEKTEQLEEYLKLTGGDITNLAEQQYGDTLKNRANVSYIAKGKRMVNGVVRDVLVVYLKDSDTTNIPSTLTVKLESGRGVEVPVVVEKNVSGIPKAQFSIGSSVQNNGSIGTVCCLIKRTEEEKSRFFVLTCSHVVNAGSSINLGGKPDKIIKVQISGGISGEVVYGLRTALYDIALIEITNPEDYESTVSVKSSPRPISNDDINETSVSINGFKSLESNNNQKRTGFVLAKLSEIPISFSDKKVIFRDLYEFGDDLNPQQCDAISVGGDSGAMIYDDNNIPIAMLIAGNERFSYGISLSDIFNKLNQLGGTITIINS